MFMLWNAQRMEKLLPRHIMAPWFWSLSVYGDVCRHMFWEQKRSVYQDLGKWDLVSNHHNYKCSPHHFFKHDHVSESVVQGFSETLFEMVDRWIFKQEQDGCKYIHRVSFIS